MALSNVINCGDLNLPISIDVQVSVSKPQVEGTVDLSVPVFVQSSGSFPSGAGRIRFYSTVDSLNQDTEVNAEAKKAGRDFFAQNPRALTMAVGQAFDTPQAGSLTTGATGIASVFTPISDGSFTVAIDGDPQDITGLDFTSDTTLTQVAATIQTALQAVGTGGYTAATCVLATSGEQFIITSGTTGELSTVSFLTTVSPASGTDVSGTGFMNGHTGNAVVTEGYTPAAIAGNLITGATGNAAAFIAVSDGSFTVSMDGISADITALNFTADTTLIDIASRIQAALQAVGTGGFTSSTCAVFGTKFLITSGTTGATSTVSVLTTTSPASGTDISGVGFMNGQAGTGVTTAGRAALGLPGELDLIKEASRCSGKFVYGWVLDASYRATISDQVAAGGWAETETAILGLTTNSPLAFDAGTSSDLGSQLVTAGYQRTFSNYHDNAEYYPEMATLSIMLSVDYAAVNSTLTAKFKNLVGIPTVGLTETKLTVLEGKRYNVFTATGQTSRVYREGTQVAASWFIDDRINLDNLEDELQVNVFNTFLRNGKIPFTLEGQTILREPIDETFSRYITNGTFGDRQVVDTSAKSGFSTLPAYVIIESPIGQSTAADRSARAGPPVTVDAQLAGAIHSISITVNAFS